MEWGSRDFLKRNKRNKKRIRKKAVDLKGADASREGYRVGLMVSPHFEGTTKVTAPMHDTWHYDVVPL